MKKISLEERFLDENLMKFVALLSVICGIISLLIPFCFHEIELLSVFEKIVKITVTLLTLWTFSKFHWDVMQGMMGALLFALIYQESFLVLGKLWGEISDFDTFLIMGLQGSLYLSAQSMSFLMTIIIVINHFIIDYCRVGNYGNVIFNQMSIVFKIFLYVFLIIINVFLNQPMHVLVNSAFEYVSDLCIFILIIFIETQLDSFKAIKQDLLREKAMRKNHE